MGRRCYLSVRRHLKNRKREFRRQRDVGGCPWWCGSSGGRHVHACQRQLDSQFDRLGTRKRDQ
eukprot:6726093-Prymnesium_polylepis.1